MPNFHAEVSEVFAEMKRAEDAARERQHALFHALRRAGVPGLASAPDDGDDGETGLRAALAGAAHEDLVHIILALTIDKRYQRYTIGQEAVLARAQDGRLSARLGIDVKTIGEKAKTSPNKIGRLLRLLASRHIFREVKPGFFAHNRLSTVLDSGKSVEEIRANPVAKHNGSRGISSLAEVVSTDHFKPAHLIPDMMVDPNWCMSEDPKLAPSPRAYGVDGIFWHIC